MCTIKYTQKCLSSLALVSTSFFSRCRERAHPLGVHTCTCRCYYIHVRACATIHINRVCFQRRNPRYRRGSMYPIHVLSILAISRHDKFFQPRAPRGPDPFSLLPSARAICARLFCPADTRDVARRRCNPRIVLSIANGFRWCESIANRIMLFSSSPAESRVFTSNSSRLLF